MDALTKVRQRNRLHAQLSSGLAVAYHLPDLKLCLIEATEAGGSESRQAWEYYRRVCASMLDAIEGEEITERDDRFAIAAALTPEERRELDGLAATGEPEPAAPAAGELQDWEDAGERNQREWLARSDERPAHGPHAETPASDEDHAHDGEHEPDRASELDGRAVGALRDHGLGESSA